MLEDMVEKVNNMETEVWISVEEWKQWKRSRRNASEILLIMEMESQGLDLPFCMKQQKSNRNNSWNNGFKDTGQ